jgi:hypothetical protein
MRKRKRKNEGRRKKATGLTPLLAMINGVFFQLRVPYFDASKKEKRKNKIALNQFN